MLETWLRPMYQAVFVNKMALKLHFVSPHYLTFLGLILGMLVLPALYFHQSILACILLLLSGYFDTLDGTVARMHDRQSSSGCVLDIISDRAVEIAVILGLFSMAPESRALASLAMTGSILLCVTSFLAVGIFTPVSDDDNHSAKSFYYSPGLIERAEAFIFFISMILFPSYFSLLAWLFTILVLLTTVMRVVQFIKATGAFN